MQPGDTITPHQSNSEKETESEDKQPSAKPQPVEEKTEPRETAEQKTSNTDQNWQYHPESNAPQEIPTDLQPVKWSASEYIEHEKPTSWYAGLAGVTIVACALVFWLTRDIITLVVIAIAAGLFGVAGARKPRTLEYELGGRGVQIGGKFYDYSSFKSFTVLEEGAINSIQLLPLKRFMPPISLYCPPEQEDAVINLIGSYLPHEERSRDPIDSLMRKVRF